MVDRVDEPMGTRCADCGAEVDPESLTAPVYSIDDESVICTSCATRRGGLWDPASERWVTLPDVSDLGERIAPP